MSVSRAVGGCNFERLGLVGGIKSLGVMGLACFTVDWSLVSMKGIAAALTYSGVSITLGLFNKAILSSYDFPSPELIIAGQVVFTVLVLGACGQFGLLPIDPFSWPLISRTWKVSILFTCNGLLTLFALDGVSMPIYTTLRRTNMLIVILVGYANDGSLPSRRVCGSLAICLAGVFVAGAYDLNFDPWSYGVVIVANFASALYMTAIKNTTDAELNSQQLLYGANLLVLPLSLLLLAVADVEKLASFPYRSDPTFAILFVFALGLGAVLNLATYWAIKVNSPLTQTVTGQMKNVLSFSISLVALPGYRYSPLNMAGMVVSLVGAILYGVAKYMDRADAPRASKAKYVSVRRDSHDAEGHTASRARVRGAEDTEEAGGESPREESVDGVRYPLPSAGPRVAFQMVPLNHG